MKHWWRKWTYEIPLAISEALWDVLVVQLAARLERLTWREVIALIPVVILVVAYAHSVPIPPELMLVGDVLAYIDIFSVLFLLGLLSRIATVVFIAKQGLARASALSACLLRRTQRRDVRHRRQVRTSAPGPRRKPDPSEDDRGIGGAWGQAAIA